MSLQTRTPSVDTPLDELEVDPYPFYAQWRRELPVGFLAATGGWYISRWDDCDELGKADGIFSERNQLTEEFFGHNILTMSGAPHDTLRASFDTWLRPRAVRAYIDEATRPVARRYIERIRDRGRGELTTELFEKVSVRVVGDVLGMKDVEDETLQRWFRHISLGSFNFAGDEIIAVDAERAKAEVGDYYETARRRLLTAPDDSGISHLIHSETPDGLPRTFDDTIGTLWVVILGAFQEPGHAATASMLGLLEAGQGAAVAQDPSLIPAAVHEGIRWLAPFGASGRTALVDLTVGDVVIPAGDEVNLLLASANRDETRYDHPEQFDLFRPRLPVASFGYGTHFCAGHFLARELERILLEEIFQELPNLRLDPEDAPEITGLFARGVKRLPVLWDAP